MGGEGQHRGTGASRPPFPGRGHRADKPPKPPKPPKAQKPPKPQVRQRPPRPAHSKPAHDAVAAEQPVEQEAVQPASPAEPPRGPLGRQVLARVRNVPSVVVLPALALVVLVLGAYLFIALTRTDTLPENSEVAGVRIGGLTPTAAERALRKGLAGRSSAAITLTAGEAKTTVDPRTAGLRVDIAASVEQATGGGRFNPVRVLRAVRGGVDVDAVATTDGPALRSAVQKAVDAIRKPVVQGGITFEKGKPVAVAPEDGRAVSADAVGDAIRHGFLRRTTVAVDVDVVEPKVKAPAVAEAMQQYAEPISSGSVELKLGDDDVVVGPETFTKAVRLEPDGSQLKPQLDVKALLTVMEPLLGSVAGAPRPATISIVGGKPRVNASKKGISFDQADLQQKFLTAALNPKAKQRRAEIKGVTSAPSFTTADAKALGVTQKVGEVALPYSYAGFRNQNLSRGAELLQGTIIQPGQTFSFADAIGKVNSDNGFAGGYEQRDGVFTKVDGAGLSQLASALYAAAFDLGLKDVEHTVLTAHNDRYPMGREVTFVPGQHDLRFANDTKYGVLVQASATPSSTTGPGGVTVSLWSTRAWEVKVRVGKQVDPKPAKVKRKRGPTCQTTLGTPGFSVDLVRVFRRPGSQAVDHRDTTRTVYPKVNAVACD